MTEDNTELDFVRELVPATSLGVGDSVPAHGLVVEFNSTDTKVFVGYGSMRGDKPDVEEAVEYEPTDTVERIATVARPPY